MYRKVKRHSFIMFFFSCLVIFNGCSRDDEDVIPRGFSGGDGTADAPLLIETPEQLFNIRYYPKKHFKLISDIDVSDYWQDWEPVGEEGKNEFQGAFDGNNYKILNLSIYRPAAENVGLFGVVNGGAIIENVNLENVSITAQHHVGALVGKNLFGYIFNSHATGEIKAQRYAGGLVGSNYDRGEIWGCYAHVDVEGETRLGGLVGWNDFGNIANSFATGDIQGKLRSGGLVGARMGGEIVNSYAVGKITGEVGTGGLVGVQWPMTGVEKSYYDEETTGQEDSGKGTAKTTAEMKEKKTFRDWDFEHVWAIDEGETYPYLQQRKEQIPYPQSGLGRIWENKGIIYMVAIFIGIWIMIIKRPQENMN